ncbi:MAG: S4 domain-containing protein [Candidatus ainarchaeum sp.]|nr:S4 domain-containing protein [Candidatus ainarchaeum sp.]
MSKKGRTTKLKSLNAPSTVNINRKENVWTVKPVAGAHKAVDSVPIGIILRNYLKLAKSIREVKMILNDDGVKVNNQIVKEYRFGVGLFDIIEIEKQKLNYLVVFDKKRRIVLKELKDKLTEKLSKVVIKKMTTKGVQITTNDGRVFLTNDVKVGDTLVIDLVKKSIKKILPAKIGAVVYITDGIHSGQKGILKEIIPGSMNKSKMVKVEQNDQSFETIIDYIMVIGEKESVLNI